MLLRLVAPFATSRHPKKYSSSNVPVGRPNLETLECPCRLGALTAPIIIYIDIYQNISYTDFEMSWTVVFSSRAEKELRKLREAEQRKARALVNAIEVLGPVQGGCPIIRSWVRIYTIVT